MNDDSDIESGKPVGGIVAMDESGGVYDPKDGYINRGDVFILVFNVPKDSLEKYLKKHAKYMMNMGQEVRSLQSKEEEIVNVSAPAELSAATAKLSDAAAELNNAAAELRTEAVELGDVTTTLVEAVGNAQKKGDKTASDLNFFINSSKETTTKINKDLESLERGVSRAHAEINVMRRQIGRTKIFLIIIFLYFTFLHVYWNIP